MSNPTWKETLHDKIRPDWRDEIDVFSRVLPIHYPEEALTPLVKQRFQEVRLRPPRFALLMLKFKPVGYLFLVILSSIIGCVIGFLKYNAYPARIFLGDSGSFILGYLIVSAALIVSIDKSTRVLDLTFPVILLAVPIADTLKVLFERTLSGKAPIYC